MEDFKPLIKNTKFVYLWTSQILSQLTIHIMNFLLLIRVFEYTGSTIATSLLWVAYALPAVIIGPFAAATVDMVDRRKILMITNLLQSAVVFVYGLGFGISFFLIYGIVLTYSFLNQFYVPAELATLPGVVDKKHLPQANGLFLLTQQGALIIGFSVAGLLKQWWGFSNSIFLGSALLFLAFLSVSFLPEMKVKQYLSRNFEEKITKFFEKIAEGYLFIKQNRTILMPFLLLMGLQISLVMVVANLPVLATDILKIDVNAAGIGLVAPAGIGAGLGAILVPRLIKKGWRKKRIIETFLMSIVVSIFLFAFLIPEISGTARVIIATAIVIAIGVSFVSVLIPSQTYLQEATPGGLRGRVFGNFWFLVTIATILPVIFSGVLTEIFGIRFLFLLLAAFALVTLIVSKKFGQKMLVNSFNLSNND